MTDKPTTPLIVGEAMVAQGWTITHRSQSAGCVQSIYVERDGSTIRIADHFLGTTIYGEEQSGSADIDIVLQEWTTLTDALAEIERDLAEF